MLWSICKLGDFSGPLSDDTKQSTVWTAGHIWTKEAVSLETTMKALGTSPPQELICFKWGRVITYKL